MKICIFFDGQNFYRSLLRYDESRPMTAPAPWALPES